MSDPLDVDEQYERTIRRWHTADVVARGKAAHGPCDVCFLLARLDAAEADLDSICGEVSRVYDHITGGRLSKPTYDAEVVIGEANDYYDQLAQEDTKEATDLLRQERDQAREDVLMLRKLMLGHSCRYSCDEATPDRLCLLAPGLLATEDYEQHRQVEGRTPGSGKAEGRASDPQHPEAQVPLGFPSAPLPGGAQEGEA